MKLIFYLIIKYTCANNIKNIYILFLKILKIHIIQKIKKIVPLKIIHFPIFQHI